LLRALITEHHLPKINRDKLPIFVSEGYDASFIHRGARGAAWTYDLSYSTLSAIFSRGTNLSGWHVFFNFKRNSSSALH
jgi:hypothetical protein